MLYRIVLMVSAASLMLSGALIAQDKHLGLGIIVGQPTGLSGKAWLDSRNALSGAAAWSFEGNDAFLLQMDYLRHDFGVLKAENTAIPVFIGIGGRITFSEKFADEIENRLGIRIPVGLNWLAKKAPIGIQFEIAPALDLVPDTEFNVSGGIAIHYYLD